MYLCVCEFVSFIVVDEPIVKLVQSTRDPEVGGSVQFVCTGISTTSPSGHGLTMNYTWFVDNASNPTGMRLTYSSNTLTVSNVSRSDQSKAVICTATEVVNRGLTSDPSSPLHINVMCKSLVCSKCNSKCVEVKINILLHLLLYLRCIYV